MKLTLLLYASLLAFTEQKEDNSVCQLAKNLLDKSDFLQCISNSENAQSDCQQYIENNMEESLDDLDDFKILYFLCREELIRKRPQEIINNQTEIRTKINCNRKNLNSYEEFTCTQSEIEIKKAQDIIKKRW